MNEATPNKTNKVNILSDIVLNPLRTPPQNVNLSVIPPLAPLSTLNEIGCKEINNTKNISVPTLVPTSSNSKQVLAPPNTNFATIQATEESLKRKSAGIFAYQETPKKPKLKVLKDQNKDEGKSDKTFFNYMTGTYEQELPEKVKISEQEVDIKDEITIQENSLQEKEEIPPTKHETEEVKQKESKDGIQVVTKPKKDLKLDDKKPTLTIDLTDDDDTESNLTVQNNIFIHNMLSLQNAITLQSLIKPDSNSKIPIQNLVFESPGDTVTNLQGNAIIQSPSSMTSNSVIIGNQNTSNVSAVSQPMVLMLQNNSPFLVPQSMVSAKTTTCNNLQSNLMLIPNNLNFQTNLAMTNNVTNPVKVGQSLEKNIVKCKNTTQKIPCRIAPRGSVTKSGGVNLVSTTSANTPLNFGTAVTYSKTSNQPPKILPLQSGAKLDVSPTKSQTNYSQNSSKNQVNSQNLISSVSFSQNLQSSAQTFVNSSQTFVNSSQILIESSSTFNNSSPSPNSISSVSSTNSLQKIQTSTTFAQNLTNALQNFMCQTCSHKARSKRDLILHIYHAHLKDEYELNLKCKVCNFETDAQSVMEKHDLEHGSGSKNQENVDNIPLSSNVEIRIRLDQRKKELVSPKKPCGSNADVTVEIIDLSDSDDDVTKKKSAGVQIFRCFDCNLLCSKLSSLQNHAERHVPSKFRCPKHHTIKDFCPECDYQKHLSKLEKNMYLCKKCEYRTFKKPCFDAHQCGNGKALFSSNSNSEGDDPASFKCFHCSHVTHSLDLLKYHAIKHFGGAFACDVHQPLKSKLCDKCVYEMILKDLKHVVHLCRCGFRTIDKKTYSIHISRKEHCQEFSRRANSEVSLDSCNESLETVSAVNVELQNSTTETKSNRKLPNTKRNVNRSSSAGKSKVTRKRTADEVLSSDTDVEEHLENFKCFHCTYVTTSRALLKCHVIKHYDQTLDCSLHPQSAPAHCKKCLYKTMLENLKKKLLLCQDCGYKTLKRSDYTRHTGNIKNCALYRKRMEKEVVQQSENESDAEIRKAANSSRKKKQKSLPSFIICAKCNYRAMDKEIFRLHEKSHENVKEEDERRQEQTLGGNIRLNCFDCNEFFTEDREKLKEHSVKHYKKKFSCNEHVPTQKKENCGKCIYYSIKKDMKDEILNCNNCYFKTLRIDLYIQHKSLISCKEQEGALGDNEDNDDDDYNPDDDVGLGKNRKLLCKTDKYNLRKRHNNVENKLENQASSSTVTTTETTYKFECMDCSSRYVQESELEEHVEVHPSSTFTCDDHPCFNELCKKCLYQYVLEKKSKGNCLSCTCCGFKSHNIEAMQSHIKSNVECDSFSKILSSPRPSDEVTNEEWACYDCDKSFNSRQKLWYHASQHRSEFKCSDHLNFSEKNCGKCVYAFIRKTMRLYFFRCFDCSNKIFASELDLKDHVEKEHKDVTFKCDIHLLNPGENCELCQYAYIVTQKCKNMYYCVDCTAKEFPYATWKNLKIHVNTYHRDSVTRCFRHLKNRPYLECRQCFYEKVLAYIRFQDKARGFKCFECPLKVFTREQLTAHVRLIHESSVFQCTIHTLGDIDKNCGMCHYEGIVVLMNNP